MKMKRITGDELEHLFERQLAEWPMVKNGFAALDSVKIKTVKVEDATFKVQFNPARIRSSAAKIDAASLKARRCFLCDENRPVEQQSIAWDDEYKVLVNPYPIFPKHFTVVCSRHTDQRIAGRMAHMMEMAEAFGDYEIFYNGPHCGASAPDHMHFQAGNKGFMPWLSDLSRVGEDILLRKGDAVMGVANIVRAAVVIRAMSIESGAEMFHRLMEMLPVPAGDSEPMVNVLCSKSCREWTISVFPRKRHRPSCYDAEGDDNILISPASVDMGGVLAIPLEKDFYKIGVREIEQIFGEVCYSYDEIADIIENENKS